MKFSEIRRAGWDTETTGINVHQDRIVTAALIVRTPDQQDRVFNWLINPGVPIPPETTKVHHIDDAKAQAEGTDPAATLDQIAGHLAHALSQRLPLVAFNTSFDWSILHYELLRYGLPTVEERIGGQALTLIDPLVIDKQMDRYVKGAGMRKLEPTAERYGVEVKDWHEATADATAALAIAERQFDRFARLTQVWDRGPAALFEAQQAWRKAHQDSLRGYFAGRGEHDKAASVRSEWPLLPVASPEPEGAAV